MGIVSMVFIGTVIEYTRMNRKKRIEINSTILLTTIALMLSQRKNANKAYSERVVKLIMYDLQE